MQKPPFPSYREAFRFWLKLGFISFGGPAGQIAIRHQELVEERRWISERRFLHYHWLVPGQMIDGPALGETTPGPLIMVVAFIGFVGGYGTAPFGPEMAALGGVAAAAVVTWFTFLPSFLFILGGAPVVEATHGNMKFTAPLTGITAAVVGVIFNLALFFAYHVLWPQGFGGTFDIFSAVLSVLAIVALLIFKR